MSCIGRHCAAHDSRHCIQISKTPSIFSFLCDPGMALLLPSFKGKAVSWCWLFSLVHNVRLQECVSVSVKALKTAPGTDFRPHIYPIESIITKTPFVFVNCKSIMNHVKASFLPQTEGSSLVTSASSNFVVRSKSVSCVGPGVQQSPHFLFPMSCPIPRPWPLTPQPPSSGAPHDLCG